MIVANNLIFEYPGLKALDQVSFNLRAGSITALVGPNGAGKTTLLRCLAALEQPSSGSIRIAGIDVLNHPRLAHRQIGYLSDFFGLYQRLTLRQCLQYVGFAQGLSEIECETALQHVSRRLGIENRLAMRPGELSRGLRQRLAIAQAIIHQPRVLLLDEPASGLDPEARHELANLFLDLQASGMTLLVSSHILAELEAYSTDMLVLRQGRIVEQVTIQSTARQKPFKLVLSHPCDRLPAVLNDIAAISVLKIERNQHALLELPDQAEQQHSLLKALLAADLPICEFAPAVSHLQDAYLQTIKNSL